MWAPDLGRMTGPRYRAIADAIAEDIAAGRLKPGDRLPTHRALAYEIGVTVGTVTRAYQEATRRGLLTGEVGRGSFVRGERKPDGFFSFETQPGRVNIGFNRPTILPEDAAAIMYALPPMVNSVGVVRNLNVDEFADLEQRCPCELMQLHGDEDDRTVASCGPGVIKAFRFDPETIVADLRRWSRLPEVSAVLVDGSAGGAGESFEWARLADALAEVPLPKPVIVAGGLD